MDTITVRVSDLREKVSELVQGKMDYVTLFLTEPDGEGDFAFPAAVNFHAYSKKHPFMAIDYEEVEAVPTYEFDPDSADTTTNIRN